VYSINAKSFKYYREYLYLNILTEAFAIAFVFGHEKCIVFVFRIIYLDPSHYLERLKINVDNYNQEFIIYMGYTLQYDTGVHLN